ncbi:MAG: hypothetical protein PHG69_04790 [Candidatus Omnitrophica bacterium]|nr:hypothetical protein [Candidatus Omnitrophota bacterium]
MLTSKEQTIIEALIEDELNSAKEVIITSDNADSIILEYIDTLFSIKRKFDRSSANNII